MFENVSSQQLNRAAQIKERIEVLQKELDAILGGSVTTASVANIPSSPRSPGRRGMSAAGKARIIAAQKARWAKFHGGKSSNGTSATKAKGKRTMSPAGRAKIAAAARLRWKKAKAAGKNAL
jgi:hypothetical protein